MWCCCNFLIGEINEWISSNWLSVFPSHSLLLLLFSEILLGSYKWGQNYVKQQSGITKYFKVQIINPVQFRNLSGIQLWKIVMQNSLWIIKLSISVWKELFRIEDVEESLKYFIGILLKGIIVNHIRVVHYAGLAQIIISCPVQIRKGRCLMTPVNKPFHKLFKFHFEFCDPSWLISSRWSKKLCNSFAIYILEITVKWAVAKKLVSIGWQQPLKWMPYNKEFWIRFDNVDPHSRWKWS